jgi:hypothetical protein
MPHDLPASRSRRFTTIRKKRTLERFTSRKEVLWMDERLRSIRLSRSDLGVRKRASAFSPAEEMEKRSDPHDGLSGLPGTGPPVLTGSKRKHVRPEGTRHSKGALATLKEP